MKKLFMQITCIMIVSFIFLQPLCTYAAGNEASHDCSLTLTYTKENVHFTGLEIKLYQVAKMTDEGDFQKAAPFDSYPVKIDEVTSQVEWNEIANTIEGYVQADEIAPYRVDITDEMGTVVFDNLEEGLYLVREVSAEFDGREYEFFSTMVCLPRMENGVYIYEIKAIPKAVAKEPVPEETLYSILKLWNDEGNDQRPESITVDILKNGGTAETVKLDSSNNWSYSFKSENADDTWSVVERNVPKGYEVKVTDRGTSFIIVNTLSESEDNIPDTPEEPEKPAPDVHDKPDTPEQPEEPVLPLPETGDNSSLRMWMAVCAVSGIGLLVSGMTIRRRENAFKK